MGVNTIRLAMYTSEYNGYCSGGDKNTLKQTVKNGVEYATELGMYVIIDWHILSDGNPNTNVTEAISFFDEMSKTYASYGNVLYEICNEPNGASWSDVKTYAQQVIPVIRANDKNGIIIVGTPTWSQDVDTAASDPITGYDNIVYALHFYAATHKDDIRNKLVTAHNKGLPVFVSEFSICEASGNGTNDTSSAQTWLDLLNSYGISYVAWNLSNKAESSSLLSSSCTKTGGFTYDDFSESGKWYLNQLN
jgi:endoglucanase